MAGSARHDPGSRPPRAAPLLASQLSTVQGFTHYGPAPANGKGWDKLLLTGDGSSLKHAVIEYADIGIQAQKKVTLDNVVPRKNRVGIYGLSGGNIATDTEVSDNLQQGLLLAASGSTTWKGGKMVSNGLSGMKAESVSPNITANLTDVLVEMHVAGGTSKSDLAYVTVEYTNRGVQLGSGAHVLDHVHIRRSAQEGLRCNNSSNVKLSALTLKENSGRGLWITSSSNVSVDGATITQNGSDGVEVNNSKTGIQIAHAAITKHKAAGLFLITSNVTTSYSALD